jgi:hypothetical protein
MTNLKRGQRAYVKGFDMSGMTTLEPCTIVRRLTDWSA